MKTLPATLLLSLLVCSCANSQDQSYPARQLIGGPCEGCEAVFEFGDRHLTATDTLPDFQTTEAPLKLTGTIYSRDGAPAPGVILYIYHTNAQGVYPTSGNEQGWGRRHGYLRGWIKTDAAGRYTFFTGMPGSYSSNPRHIHPLLLEPDGKYYYIDAWRFRDDPNLPQHPSYENRGGSGIVAVEEKNGFRTAKRDIVLGANVPDY